jgi:hypothetical protein
MFDLDLREAFGQIIDLEPTGGIGLGVNGSVDRHKGVGDGGAMFGLDDATPERGGRRRLCEEDRKQ